MAFPTAPILNARLLFNRTHITLFNGTRRFGALSYEQIYWTLKNDTVVGALDKNRRVNVSDLSWSRGVNFSSVEVQGPISVEKFTLNKRKEPFPMRYLANFSSTGGLKTSESSVNDIYLI